MQSNLAGRVKHEESKWGEMILLPIILTVT